MTSLFDDRKTRGPSAYGFVASLLLHVAVLLIFFVGLAHNPLIIEAAIPLYKAQMVDLHSPAFRIRLPKLPYLSTEKATRPTKVENSSHITAAASMYVDSGTRAEGQSPQTLLRPTTITKTLSEEIPLPALLMTSRADVAAPRVAPQVQVPTMPNRKAELQIPIDENVSEILIQASSMPDQRFPLTAGTTTPIALPGPASDKLPQTTSDRDSVSVSTNALSLSDVHLANGVTSLPMTNEVAGNGEALNTHGTGTTGSGNDPDAAESERLETRHVILPREGQFGLVVVGASLEELYPQTSAIWGSRLAYTVYLNVGTAKQWILQYSPLRSVATLANGQPKRLEAPWPTDIVVPNIQGEINADVLLVHGYLNASGKFERISIAFPPGFQFSQFVLDSLQQWQFRPARQDGHAANVEVLLIIP